MVVVEMLKKNHEQFVEKLQYFVAKFVLIEKIVVVKLSLMKNKGF